MFPLLSGAENLIGHLTIKIRKFIGKHGPDFHTGLMGFFHIIGASKGNQIPVCILEIEPSRADRINPRRFFQNLLQFLIGGFTVNTMPCHVNLIIFRNTRELRLCKIRFFQRYRGRLFQIFIQNPAVISVFGNHLCPFITAAVVQYIELFALFQLPENRTFNTALIADRRFLSTDRCHIGFTPYGADNDPVWIRKYVTIHLCVFFQEIQRNIQHTVSGNDYRDIAGFTGISNPVAGGIRCILCHSFRRRIQNNIFICLPVNSGIKFFVCCVCIHIDIALTIINRRNVHHFIIQCNRIFPFTDAICRIIIYHICFRPQFID